MKETNLQIEGMHCAGCSTRLEKVLNNLEGVEKAQVNLQEKKATIKYDENKISLKSIKEAIEDAGFKGE
ncbi:copper-transporting ATPase homolog [Clostridium sp. CAG:389]|nr:copper-transporting ATPase homolog [Clostridium sp. CAG:389]